MPHFLMREKKRNAGAKQGKQAPNKNLLAPAFRPFSVKGWLWSYDMVSSMCSASSLRAAIVTSSGT